jgi:DNA-binding transcriptional LysR family regulator
VTEANLKEHIAEIPLATSIGGQFRKTLESAAAKAKWPLWIAVSCASFTQAARILTVGEFGAVLPTFAAQDFDSAKVVTVPLPFLRGQSRHICVAWNPRLVEVRPVVERAWATLSSLAS